MLLRFEVRLPTSAHADISVPIRLLMCNGLQLYPALFTPVVTMYCTVCFHSPLHLTSYRHFPTSFPISTTLYPFPLPTSFHHFLFWHRLPLTIIGRRTRTQVVNFVLQKNPDTNSTHDNYIDQLFTSRRIQTLIRTPLSIKYAAIDPLATPLSVISSIYCIEFDCSESWEIPWIIITYSW